MKRLFARSAPPLDLILLTMAIVAALQLPIHYIFLNISIVAGIVVNQVGIILALPLAIILVAGYSPIPLIRMRRPGRMQMLTAICVTLGCAVMLNYIKAATTYFFPVPRIMLAGQTQIITVYSWHDFFLKLTLLGVLAPFCEEMFFRGILQSALERRIGAWKSIVTTAILFALIHSASFHPHILLILGLVLSWLYYATGSIRVTIICHAISNCWALANQMRGVSIPLSFPPQLSDALLAASATAIVIAGTAWLYYKRRQEIG